MEKKDIEFLKELQHEMNTQDTVSQANPRFWVVRGTVREYGVDEGYSDGSTLIIDDDTYDDMKEISEYLVDNYRNTEKIHNFKYEEDDDCIFYLDEDDEECVLNDLDEVVDLLDICGAYISYYKNVEKIYENTFFLTNAECKAHIEANYYHYPKDAHSYAMTAWRAYEVEKLWKILQTTNWDEFYKEVTKII